MTEAHPSDSLLPCPHCGSAAVQGENFDDQHYVMCSGENDDCGAVIGWKKTEAAARTNWNRRALAAPGGEGEPVAGRLEPGDLFWGVCRASHIATNAVAVLRADPGNVGPVLEGLERLAKEMDEVVNGDGQVLFTAPPEPVAWRPDRESVARAMLDLFASLAGPPSWGDTLRAADAILALTAPPAKGGA